MVTSVMMRMTMMVMMMVTSVMMMMTVMTMMYAGCAIRITDKFYLCAVERKWHSSCLKVTFYIYRKKKKMYFCSILVAE